MAFCDFCDCDDCQLGSDFLYHAQTNIGTWICNVCYAYDVCTSGPNRNSDGPCARKDCVHRPRIINDWLPYAQVV